MNSIKSFYIFVLFISLLGSPLNYPALSLPDHEDMYLGSTQAKSGETVNVVWEKIQPGSEANDFWHRYVEKATKGRRFLDAVREPEWSSLTPTTWCASSGLPMEAYNKLRDLESDTKSFRTLSSITQNYPTAINAFQDSLNLLRSEPQREERIVSVVYALKEIPDDYLVRGKNGVIEWARQNEGENVLMSFAATMSADVPRPYVVHYGIFSNPWRYLNYGFDGKYRGLSMQLHGFSAKVHKDIFGKVYMLTSPIGLMLGIMKQAMPEGSVFSEADKSQQVYTMPEEGKECVRHYETGAELYVGPSVHKLIFVNGDRINGVSAIVLEKLAQIFTGKMISLH